MSRIHEALKKAELERGGGRDGDANTQIAGGLGGEQGEMRTASTLTAELPKKDGSRHEAEGRVDLDALLKHCSHPVWQPDPNVNVFFSATVDANVTEQFRTLRSRLYQLRSAQPLRTLLITSPLAREGKTFVATNLAQAIVRQSDRSVLIIDADLRCSRLHFPLGAPLAPGLTDYLQGSVSEMEVIQHGQEGNLFLIPGGSSVSNPSELLSNGRVKKLLDRLSAIFDWVILDSPPCLPVADAHVLADFCDGLLLVVRAGSTPAAVVERAGKELHDRNIVGVVLNAIDRPLSYGSYYASGTYGEQAGQQ